MFYKDNITTQHVHFTRNTHLSTFAGTHKLRSALVLDKIKNIDVR